MIDRTAFDETLANARRMLLQCRTADGHWEGRLSSSALSTATAVFALARMGAHEQLVRRGIEWVIAHQNADGGWGDTTLSISNISTTTLCWAALSISPEAARSATERAQRWLSGAAGGLEPARLAEAIAKRYGEDKTFSVPILTMCAMAGRLGGSEGWRLVPQLPFELAACPHTWFKRLRLRVVSYALPALIAMGQARHAQRPTRNPATRFVRQLVRGRTLRVLEEIQPRSGGFLEAAPLTSFVVMSLVAAGQERHPVAKRGAEFLVRSVREDGSWPIDTNLATWCTTSAVNALAAGGDLEKLLTAEERRAIRDWLLAQQYRVEHPYTHAAPGGWAWTDLSGGVSDADDTAGALLAMRHLGLEDAQTIEAACAGVRWLVDLQNSDGGIPTFCRGWGKLDFDRSGADLTAHALLAWNAWKERLPAKQAAKVARAMERAIGYLVSRRRSDGAWVPLWFGNQHAPGDENPAYGTARVAQALGTLRIDQPLEPHGWLLQNQNEDGGWGGMRGVESSIEETALAVTALAAMKSSAESPLRLAIERGLQWLIDKTSRGTEFPPSPIGLYFAKLWYFDMLYPVIFMAGALGAARNMVFSEGT